MNFWPTQYLFIAKGKVLLQLERHWDGNTQPGERATVDVAKSKSCLTKTNTPCGPEPTIEMLLRTRPPK